MSQLKNLSEIFESRLLRIPDYQRGYAWTEHELEYFWEDLMNLHGDRIHYTGMITLEPLSKKDIATWEDDAWLVNILDYKPCYVVDGQQRLTTSIILVQAILERYEADDSLVLEPVSMHSQKYILKEHSADGRKSFVFGYTKDDPSFEYLKTQIFGKSSTTNQGTLTLYTQNLQKAKEFFSEKLEGMTKEEIEKVFLKLTKRFKFNLYEVEDEIDVFVTFETMNNRGKSLSSLEILKNRLIYLSTLFHDDDSRHALRKDINESWKTIYEFLGKNPDNKLSDNLFLRNHWTMFFKYSRKKGDDYIKFLLDEEFTTRNVLSDSNDENHVSIDSISEYVKSLQIAARYWFYMHNPYVDVPGMEKNEQNRILLHRLERLSFRSFKPLILAAYCSGASFSEINKLLAAAERYNFTLFTLSQRRANTGDTEFFTAARDLLKGRVSIDAIVENIEDWVKRYYSAEKFKTYMLDDRFWERHGYYSWDGLRYFLYEYEEHLKKRGKHAQTKLNWVTFNERKKDHVSVEHIYPQTESEDWVVDFEGFSKNEKHYIAHSLGNLLPLSRHKNSKLQNYAFSIKKDDGDGCGYYNGCCSENEVNKEPKWGPDEIKARGLTMLKFMEERWNIVLGDDEFKTELLGFSFGGNKEADPIEDDLEEAAE